MGPFGLAVLPGAGFEVGFGSLSETDEKLVQGLIARRGTLEFAIEVLPDSVYVAMLSPAEAPPARLGLWSGTPEEFATFKAAEWDRWKKMQSEPGGYTPSRSDMRLVRMRDRDGTHVEHYRLVEHKPADERLDGRILKDAVQMTDQTGRPAVVFDIRRNYQGVLASFTRSNIGLPLAIMVDDALVSAPRIMDTLSTNVQISMGTKAHAELLRDARDLATVLQSRSLPFTPQFVKVESR
jgi:preprotein translocase subunit SecD